MSLETIESNNQAEGAATEVEAEEHAKELAEELADPKRPSSAVSTEGLTAVPKEASRASLPSSPWVSREQSRTKDLCNWFGIPETETLLDDFACAMRKRILLQGKLFVFDHYVCFNSNVFGYVKRKVIHIPDIVAVRKKTHLKFPNSIEIEDSNGKEFFTSFLARENAFRIIVTLWGRERPGAVDQQGEGSDTPYYGRSTGAFCRASTSGLPSLIAPGSAGPASSFFEMLGIARRRSAVAIPPSPSATVLQDGAQPSPSTEATGRRTLTGELDEDEADGGEERDEDEEDTCSVWSVVEPGPAPALHKDSKLMVSTTLPGTLKDVFEVLLANDSHFLEDALEQMGNRRVNIDTWKRTEQLGHIRDVQFVAPIKGAFSNWGVPQTRCFVTHRFCRYPGQHLLFESSQTNMDIPYGDCFTVDKRWDVRPDPQASPQQPAMLVEVHLRVPFSRMCFFRKIIESGTFSQSKETISFILHRLREALEEREVQRLREEPEVLLPNSPVPGSRMMSPSASTQALGGLTGKPSHQYSLRSTPADVASDQGSPVRRAGSLPRPASASSMVGALGSGITLLAMMPLRLAKGLASCCGKGGATPRCQLLVLLLVLAVCALQLYLALRSPAASPAAPAGARGGPPASCPFVEQERSYWLQRLEMLHQELQLLQRRTEAVSAELAGVVQVLSSTSAAAASAAAGGGGAAGVGKLGAEQ